LVHQKQEFTAGRHWLILVILTTLEAEIRRIGVQSQPGQIVRRPYLEKNPSQKRAGGVAQRVGPEFKPRTGKQQTNKQNPPRLQS
jgi:hypothetical protein